MKWSRVATTHWPPRRHGAKRRHHGISWGCGARLVMGALRTAHLAPAKPASERWFWKSHRVSNGCNLPLRRSKAGRSARFQVLCEALTEPHACMRGPADHMGLLNLPTLLRRTKEERFESGLQRLGKSDSLPSSPGAPLAGASGWGS